MKICHCIKLTPQEKTALGIVQDILHEMAADEMICDDFDRVTQGDCLDEINVWFGDVVNYLINFDSGE